MQKRTIKKWEQSELEYLKDNYEHFACHIIAAKLNRTTRSVQHKFRELGLERGRAKVGDIVKGWKIVEIFNKYNGNQNISMAKIESTVNDKKRVVSLSSMTNEQIAYPIIKRPDIALRDNYHGKSHSRMFRIWTGMKSRCLNKKHGNYHNYGGRGITICDDWLDFKNFEKWAELNGYKEDLTLDRIDGSKGYCPENCRWATKVEQTINKKNTDDLFLTCFGERKHVIEWSKDSRCVVNHPTLKYRIRADWEPERALTQPAERKRKKNLTNWLKEIYPNTYEEYKNS